MIRRHSGALVGACAMQIGDSLARVMSVCICVPLSFILCCRNVSEYALSIKG